MPTADQIHFGLSEIANSWPYLAIFWHVYFLVIAVLLVFRAGSSARICGLLLSLPLFSVGTLAWMAKNPFNGMVFTALGMVLLVVSSIYSRINTSVSTGWTLGAGILMSGFGFVYPHFIVTESYIEYLYSAPTGLIPCPTLSVVIGLSLILGWHRSRSWSYVLGTTGLFYGIYGATYLGVTLDWVLFVGALLLIWSSTWKKLADPARSDRVDENGPPDKALQSDAAKPRR